MVKEGQIGNTTGRVLALHKAELGLIPATPSDPKALQGVISEHRESSE